MLLSRRLAGAVLVAAGLAGSGSPARAADSVTVFAAASLKTALDAAAAAYTAKTGTAITTSYGGSSSLAKQIEQGAPAALFASADVDWMDYLQTRKLVQPATRVDLLGNTLVVIAPASSPLGTLELTPAAFDKAVGDSRWTTGTVNAVPCGIYAKAALTKLGLWSVAEPKLAQTPDVRTATAFVARGEAPLGIVYLTDAHAEKAVKVVSTFPDDSHAPIVYPFALTTIATGPAPAAFLAYLVSAEAKPFFEKQGFRMLKP